MGYSLRNVFTKEPQAISSAVIAILNVLTLAGVIGLSPEVVLAIDATLVLVLGLFYVRPLTASKAALRELAPARSKKPRSPR